MRLLLLGFGSVNQRLCELLKENADTLAAFDFRIVAVSDSKGGVFNAKGLSIDELLSTKKETGSVVRVSKGTVRFRDSEAMVAAIDSYDILVDGSPNNLQNGSPGLQCILKALRRGKKVVAANKAPFVIGWHHIFDLIRDKRNWRDTLGFSAAVCGGLPVVDVLTTELLATGGVNEFTKVRGVLNSTTNHILSAMFDDGTAAHTALRQAQSEGVAETDPTLDIDGSDAANKLCIILKTMGYTNTEFADIERVGIENVTQPMVAEAKASDRVIRLVAEATKCATAKRGWRMSVKPQSVELCSFLGQTHGQSMAIELDSKLFGPMKLFSEEKGGVTPTASAVLRDLVYMTQQHTKKRYSYHFPSKL